MMRIWLMIGPTETLCAFHWWEIYMRSFCGQASRIIDTVLNKIIIAMFAVLLFDVWFAVLDRYIFKWQVIWVEEAARYLMVWTMLLAIATAMYRRQHVFISFIYEKVPEKQRLLLAAFIDLVSIAVFLVLLFYLSVSLLRPSVHVPQFLECL